VLEGWPASRSPRGELGLPAVTQLSIALSEGWYRYGDSNPGPVAEKRSRRLDGLRLRRFCWEFRTDLRAESGQNGSFRAQSFKNLSSGHVARWLRDLLAVKSPGGTRAKWKSGDGWTWVGVRCSGWDLTTRCGHPNNLAAHLPRSRLTQRRRKRTSLPHEHSIVNNAVETTARPHFDVLSVDPNGEGSVLQFPL
jgi:hypothetical protein